MTNPTPTAPAATPNASTQKQDQNAKNDSVAVKDAPAADAAKPVAPAATPAPAVAEKV